MSEIDLADVLGPALAAALDTKGYTALTPVQEAVLDPALAGRDLRITSQTGSGKTIAIGFAVRELVTAADEPADEETGDGGARPPHGARKKIAPPRVMVIAPTRELVKQVQEELAWLFAPLDVKVVSVAGGASYRDEHRALAGGPAIVVGTPGRLLDHLNRGSVDATRLGAVVLDEADRMLDLGFRDDLEAIFAHMPEGRTTHLVSATFPREVRTLADRVQKNPAHVEGTRLGAANVDIDHVIHLVDSRERLDAIVNLLLANPDEQTLIFARTRADVAHVAKELALAGFSVSALSGEMEQRERNRALAAFRTSGHRALVATDVAARGLDVDIARVIHAEPPDDADSYTHRSGRTGRAGRKGTSSILVTPSAVRKTVYLLQRAGVSFRYEPIPSAESIREASDERTFAALTADDPPDFAGFDDRAWSLAKRIAATENVTRVLARLLATSRHAGPTAPREVRRIEPERARPPAAARPSRGAYGSSDSRPARGDYGARLPRPARAEHGPTPVRPARAEYGTPPPRSARSERGDYAAALPRPARAERGEFRPSATPPPRGPHDAPSPRGGHDAGESRTKSWVPFRVSWGREGGADARRLMAMLCRRGAIRGSDLGAIRIGDESSTVEVSADVAEGFADATRKADPQNPGVLVRPDDTAGRERRPDDAARERRPAAAASTERRPSRPAFDKKPRREAPGGDRPPTRERPAMKRRVVR